MATARDGAFDQPTVFGGFRRDRDGIDGGKQSFESSKKAVLYLAAACLPRSTSASQMPASVARGSSFTPRPRNWHDNGRTKEYRYGSCSLHRQRVARALNALLGAGLGGTIDRLGDEKRRQAGFRGVVRCRPPAHDIEKGRMMSRRRTDVAAIPASPISNDL